MSTMALKRGRVGKRPAKNTRYRGAKGGKAASSSSRVAGFLGRLFMLALMLAFVAAVSLGLLAAYRWMTVNPYFALQAITVSGNQRLGDGEVVALSGVSLGQNSLAVNMTDVEARLSSNPWIESVVLKRELPATLHIGVRERQASFWAQQGGRLFYADEHGRLIEPVTPEKFASLPVLHVEQGAEDWLNEMPAFLKGLDERRWPFGQSAIGWVAVSLKKGVEIFLLKPELVIRLDLNDWDSGLKKVAVVWADLVKRGELANVSEIVSGGDKVRVTFGKRGLQG